MARSTGRAPVSSNTTKSKSSSAKFHSKGTGKANAAGYLKRKESGKKTPGKEQIQNVYEELDNEERRQGKGKDKSGRKARKETKELEYDWGEDGYAARSGSDGEEGGGVKQPRLFGEGDEIEGSEDEEIDSDAAFSDEDGVGDGFGGVFARKKQQIQKKSKKQAVRFAEVDLDEDNDGLLPAAHNSASEADSDEEEQDLDSDTYIDILDVLDGKGQVWNGEDSASDNDTSKPVAKAIPLRSQSDSEEDEESDLDEDALTNDDDPMDSDTSPEALTNLHQFISSLPSATKRKADDDPSASAPRKKRAFAIQERTQAGVEGEFTVGATGKLSLDDFLNPLDAMTDVRKSLSSSSNTKTGSKKKAKTPGLLSAPLPTRAQDRLDRTAAYEATREEVQKWEGSMKLIREAEHLSFPLQQPKHAVGKLSNPELAAKFTPTTNLETAVSRLLSAAHLAQEGDIAQTENTLLAQSALSPEEVLQRRNELRMMRELAFRAEVKARRVGKIKSKAFRKIARGKKKREAAKGADESEEEDDEKRMQREVERAKARAGLKVKRSAKWDLARAGNGEDIDNDDGQFTSEALREIERGERLQRLIRGEDLDETNSNEDESDSDDDDQGADSIKRKALAKLATLNNDEEEDVDAAMGKKKKGVFAMKFMQDAMRRKEAEAKGMADDFEAELARLEAAEPGDITEAVVVQRTGGRFVVRPADAANNATTTTKPTTAPPPPPVSIKTAPRSVLSAAASASTLTPATDENPWLAVANSFSSGAKQTKKKNTVVVSKESGVADRAGYRLGKAETKKTKGLEWADEDVEVDLDKLLGDDAPAEASNNAKTKKQKKKDKPKAEKSTVASATDANSDDGDDGNSEVDAQEAMLARKGKGNKGAFEQRELVARAFAGDNVVRDFEEAKQREIASDAPKEVDLTLPGWGSWGGPHASSNQSKKKFTQQIPGVLPTARADHGKAHIIISEKMDKKAAKYLVKDLPYPFTSKAQYERSLQTPVGREWNTRVAFQRGTLPSVVKKMGTVIEPLQKLV
ncbi:Utp14-domain-containing protein [Mycena amicta]|nr:Utp14-domain-containing protein [Mycena amicta]